MHGKDIADGDGSAVSGVVKSSFYDDYRKGTQNIVRHLAYNIHCQIWSEETDTMERKAFTQQQNVFTCFWRNTQWMNLLLLHKEAIGVQAMTILIVLLESREKLPVY